ncbi:MAG TPA: YhdH/YhfP family quinone oxidoreductase [Anaerolineaceae bacterium]|nr:YhdH/YhfP family quinone oxidoreductase [Anaerolineaceae bacterium]
MEKQFLALVVREQADGSFTRSIDQRTIDDLPEGDVLVRVLYSSLNYKDALSASGNKGVTKTYPHTPGIDAAGVVEESRSADFQPGAEVLVSGYELGVSIPGGFGQFIRVPADRVMPRPEGLTLYESMVYGTAGFTAAASVAALIESGVSSGDGPVLVTGATGGVGSFAVALLAREGYEVVAATGKLEQRDYLTRLGASEVIHRQELLEGAGRPLLKSRWAGVVDTVGGAYLAAAIAAARYQGTVTACGNAAGAELHTTVFPFILRGVRLLGIDTAQLPLPQRKTLWQRIAGEWKLPGLEQIGRRVSFAELDAEIERILTGGQTGRVVVDLWAD